MYDNAKEAIIRIPYPAKEATLRLPNEAEAEAYVDALSKRKTDDDRQPVIDLFNIIRIDGDEFDEYEMEYAIDRLLAYEVVGFEKEGDEYTVSLKTPFGLTIHTMRPPSIKEMTQYNAASHEPKASRKAAVRLYDSIVIRSEGYAEKTPVPFFHKHVTALRVNAVHSNIDPIHLDPNA